MDSFFNVLNVIFTIQKIKAPRTAFSSFLMTLLLRKFISLMKVTEMHMPTLSTPYSKITSKCLLPMFSPVLYLLTDSLCVVTEGLC